MLCLMTNVLVCLVLTIQKCLKNTTCIFCCLGFRNPETEQALIDAGFGDIVSNKPREQIAFLLIEIARLNDDLEAAKEQCFIQTPDGKYTAEQLYNMLQEDRQDLPFSSKVLGSSQGLSYVFVCVRIAKL